MPTTLKETIDSAGQFPTPKNTLKRNVAEELLGKYSDVIPPEMTSSEFIKKLRNSLHNKVKA